MYFAGSHADVILSRLLDGYLFDGTHHEPRIELAAVYLEQLGSHDHEPISRTDVGVETLAAHGVERFGARSARRSGWGGPASMSTGC